MHEDLMEQVVTEENLARARAAVKRNRGAAGIDRLRIASGWPKRWSGANFCQAPPEPGSRRRALPSQVSGFP